MADTTANQPAAPVQPKAASMKELKAAFPDAGNDFLVAQLEADATLDLATDNYIKALSAQAKAAKDEADALKNAAATAGVKPVKTTPKNAKKGEDCKDDVDDDAEDIDPEDHIARFNALVMAQIKAGKSRDKAIAQVVMKNPELHKNYLIATNPSNRSKRLIDEKFEMSGRK